MSYEASFQSYPQNESILSPPHYISRQLLLFCLQLAGTAEKLAACIYEYEPHLCAGTSLGSSVHYDPVNACQLYKCCSCSQIDWEDEERIAKDLCGALISLLIPNPMQNPKYLPSSTYLQVRALRGDSFGVHSYR